MRRQTRAFFKALQAFWGSLHRSEQRGETGIALALGGGFARGIAHIGVLRVLERERIPVACVAGVSAGSIVAAGFAAGADSHELEQIARRLRWSDFAKWSLSRLGLITSERMEAFLKRILPVHRFEHMRLPLAVVATDLKTGEPVIFQGEGELFTAVRASCSYPGLFQPVRHQGRYLVDGAIAMEIPAPALRRMGMRKIVSVALPAPVPPAEPASMFAVVNRCFQIMQSRTEHHWRSHSDVVLTPDVSGVNWDDFNQVDKLIESGMRAAEQMLPSVRKLIEPAPTPVAMQPARVTA